MPELLPRRTPEGRRTLRFTDNSGVRPGGDLSRRGGDDEVEHDAGLTG